MRGSARRAAAIISTCFLGGCLLRSLPVDYDILFKEVTTAAEAKAESFYLLWWNSPLGVRALLHGVMATTGLSIASKLATWSEAAMHFDGLSLFLYVFGATIYFGIMLPSIYMLTPIGTPRSAVFNFNEIFNLQRNETILEREPLSPAKRSETLGIVCACSVLLLAGIVGIIALQIGDWYVERKTEQAIRAQEIEQAENIRGRLKAE